MQNYPITRHQLLTRWFQHIREHVLAASQQAISSVPGGPSQPQVSRAESDPEFPLTQDLLRRLGSAYHHLAPNKFSEHAPSLVEAKAAAYTAAEPPVDDRVRQAELWATSTEPRNHIVLGIDLATGGLITGTSLRLAQPVDIIRGITEFTDQTDTYLAEAAGEAYPEFDQQVYQIAAWFNGVTIVEDSDPGLGAMIDYWNRRAKDHKRPASVHRDIMKRFDPIAGIQTLLQAVATAREMQGHTDNPTIIDQTAWVLLLANMIGARENISPIEAWELYRGDSSLWSELYKKLDTRLIKRLPHISEMLTTAGPILNRWCRESPTDGWDVGWTKDADGNPIWDIRPPDDPARIFPARGDLLIAKPGEDHALIESMLQRQQIPTATVESAAAVPGRDRHLRFCGIRMNSVADTAPFAWAPTGLRNSSYGLLRNEITKQWRAAQLF